MTSLLLIVHQQGEEDEVLMPLTVIKKSDWTTLSVDRNTTKSKESIPERVFLNLFFTQQCRNYSGCTKFLQEIEPSVTKVNFFVSNHGTVFEDLGWTATEKIVISFLGDENNFPSAASLKAIEDLLDSGVKNGDLAKNYKIGVTSSFWGWSESAKKSPHWKTLISWISD